MKLRDAILSALTAMAVSAVTALAINPPFSTQWSPSYESVPADTEQESLGASRIRDLKLQLRERLAQDHSWAGDGNDGYHKQVTLIEQTQQPIPAFDAGATGGTLFAEQIGGEAELLYADDHGHTTQLTSQGNLITNTPAGQIAFFANPTLPSGWIAADGSAVSRTGQANLFANIGTTYGTGDGSTTFNLPDCRGGVLYGRDPSNSTGRLTGLSGGVNASALGNRGGGQQFTIAQGNLPALPVTIHDPSHTHTVNMQLTSVNTNINNGAGPAVAEPGTTQTTASFTGITATIDSVGADSPITSALPPGLVVTCAIKT